VRERTKRSPEEAISGLAQIEYRLARDTTIREYRRGRLSRIDVCDAQPELLRVASNLGRPTEIECPICEDNELVQVLFAFGPRLPSGGRALRTTTEVRGLSRSGEEVAFYLVEVCVQCRWNHLLRMFTDRAARKRVTG
jgi:hypothetical protein